MDKLVDVIKIFLDKYFIPTIIAISATIFFVATYPDCLKLRSNTNEFLYYILVFCLVFLFVLSICKAYKTICSKIERSNAKEQHQQYVETEKRKVLEELWTFVDKLSIPNKQALFSFLRTNNTPIESSDTYASDSIFYNRDIMHETIARAIQEESFCPTTNRKNNGHIVIPIEHPIISIPVKKYRLNDSFFSLLKYSYGKYNRISHFEEDNQYD
ncbi:MAG TPA: hypothetical protein DIC60_05685 [Lachnospiraceae bacterium]|nr:hypothetical protein [Lachnospiraceae bacterium]